MILAFEGFAAELAGEASLVAMRQLVLGQRRCTGKHLGTHLLSVKSKPTRRGGGGGGGGRKGKEKEKRPRKREEKDKCWMTSWFNSSFKVHAFHWVLFSVGS